MSVMKSHATSVSHDNSLVEPPLILMEEEPVVAMVVLLLPLLPLVSVVGVPVCVEREVLEAPRVTVGVAEATVLSELITK